ncbi:MAG: hypothetical protein ABIG44_08635 [Planctomycetota bacterium]
MSARAIAHRFLARWTFWLLAVSVWVVPGCTWVTYLGTDPRGSEGGRTYYVGGAGPFGHVGTIDVPTGLRRSGYRGSIEVFGWQGTLPSTVRDQVDSNRNRQQARRLAGRIADYLRQYPGCPVNIIALSAGTGVATWALEALPEECRVGTVIFLGSSLSREYDLSRALQRIDERLYNYYSPDDPVLRYALPLAGSVDRETRGRNIAGLFGFELPAEADAATHALYAERLVNRPYHKRYRQYGYRGMHTDATSPEFVHIVLSPLLMRGPRDAQPAAP